MPYRIIGMWVIAQGCGVAFLCLPGVPVARMRCLIIKHQGQLLVRRIVGMWVVVQGGVRSFLSVLVFSTTALRALPQVGWLSTRGLDENVRVM